jgi:large subunit ribosomal protein L4
MTAHVLTVEAARAAKIGVVENGKYTEIVHDVIVAIQANRRAGTASTKTKATVNGSGAKPWRQKGTGRARAGYRSSPVWVGGGVAFGPHPRDYSKKINKQVKRLALRKALSERILAGKILVTEAFYVSSPKTKLFISALESISPERDIMVVSTEFDANTYMAARNVGDALLMTAAELNTEHVLRYDTIVVTSGALAELAKRINK